MSNQDDTERRDTPAIEGAVSMWVRTASRNATIDWLRQHARHLQREAVSLDAAGFVVPDTGDESERHIASRELFFRFRPVFERALARLSERQRFVLQRHLFEDRPFKEILAEIRDTESGEGGHLTRPALYRRYHDALGRFRELVLESFDGTLGANGFSGGKHDPELQERAKQLRALLGRSSA